MELQGQLRTPTLSIMTSNFVIRPGKKYVSIQTSSDFAGTILGTAGAADFFYAFPAPAGDTLASIAVTCTAGSFTIITI